MKVCLCIICVTQGVKSAFFASRFMGTYASYEPGHPHDTLIVANGGPVSTELGLIFEPLQPKYFPRANDPGWDISGYIAAAHGPAADCDLFVALGESVYFHRPSWLARIVDAWNMHGPGMYGFWSSNLVSPHLNTTAFATHPELLRDYPHPVTNHAERYQFEHGTRAFWRHVRSRGMPTKLVTFDGEWDPFLWRYPPNILFRGDQSNCLALCNHTDRYANSDEQTKRTWARYADQQPLESLREPARPLTRV